ncbi:hypothetical protein VE01_07077 [Pseudogymnoascus verrucosus]|uniref:C2H2-type domain-containing protein n=1 Tax=Pseudogymnoascus verrucosus TaxID=342668 RepID=A0A1B8GDZ0_9PEZI|nr:uncharacterized protein VE01_07077 [Pseudogymnoascus verrucosus]OBT94046.1 hypothetical protein VE01_07077 [Pseudogymnoascus verrucosus]
MSFGCGVGDIISIISIISSVDTFIKACRETSATIKTLHQELQNLGTWLGELQQEESNFGELATELLSKRQRIEAEVELKLHRLLRRIFAIIAFGLSQSLGSLAITRRPPPRHRRRSCASVNNPRPQPTLVSENLSRFAFFIRQPSGPLPDVISQLTPGASARLVETKHYSDEESNYATIYEQPIVPTLYPDPQYPLSKPFMDETTISSWPSPENPEFGYSSTNGDAQKTSSTPSASSTPHTSSSAFGSTASGNIDWISCEFAGCQRTFTQRHIYNKHKKSHEHPEHCSMCGRGFETNKDVRRHIKDKHQSTKDFHCLVTGCKYAQGGKRDGFARKENWKRHLRNQHGMGDESP